MAEDGDTGPISELFSAATIPGHVLDATIASVGPIPPGTTVEFEFQIDKSDLGSIDLYFSYASMVVPSVSRILSCLPFGRWLTACAEKMSSNHISMNTSHRTMRL